MENQSQGEIFFNNLTRLIQNEQELRMKMASAMLDPRRDLYEECGYPQTITIDHYLDRYLRGDVGRRVVSIASEEVWGIDPDVYETEDGEFTEFEKSFNDFIQQSNLWSYLEVADELCGIGQFSIILLGVKDGKALSEPLDGVIGGTGISGPADRELLYMRVFDQSRVTILEYEKDPKSPRCGMPTRYSIRLIDPSVIMSPISQIGSIAGTTTSVSPVGYQTVEIGTVEVHWTRVIHWVDNPAVSTLACSPRMEAVFNRLCDLNKLCGGSAEMFWRGAFPGFSFETQPSTTDLSEDEEWRKAIRGEFENYANGLRRFIATVGMTVKPLAPQVEDPSNHIRIQIEMICATIGVPYRQFMGSESGHLASTQDSESRNKRVSRRQKNATTPSIRSVINRLQLCGVLPYPKNPEKPLIIRWRDLNTVSAMDQSNVSQKRSDALARYIQSKTYRLMTPFNFFVKIMNFTYDEARVLVDSIVNDLGLDDESELIDSLDAVDAVPSLGDPNQTGSISTQPDNRISSAPNPGGRAPDSNVN